MLQICSGLYFRAPVALNSQRHRQVYYTNRSFLPLDDVEFPVGRILPSTSMTPVSAVMIEAIEHREKITEDGRDDFVLASGGTELLDDIADVLSFAMNSIFSRDHDLVHRLVPRSSEPPIRPSHERAADQLRDTFKPDRYATPDTIEDAREFMRKLLALRRPEYEAAMRAIRRVIGAWRKIGDRPTAAYTDLVAALESLADKAQHVPAPTWDNVDSRKRTVLDPVLADLSEDKRNQIRDAVIEADRAGARLRFTEFVISHVSPDFYRDQAAGAISPVRGPDLRRALNTAYAIRSNDVHALRDLPPEAWSWVGSAETVDVGGLGRILTIEGLSRLARHIVRAFLDEAPTDLDYDFDWRAAVPGQRIVTLAPQYWLWQAAGLHAKTAPTYFDGLLSHLIDIKMRGDTQIADLSAGLKRIEQLLPTLSPGAPGRLELVGIYALWHRTVAADLRRPNADTLLATYSTDLTTPSAVAFAVGLLTDTLPNWTAQHYLELATARHTARTAKKPTPLPHGIDTALLLIAAEQCADAQMTEHAATLAAWAVEELPGNPTLQSWEASLTADGFTDSIDLRALVLTCLTAPSTDTPEAENTESAERETDSTCEADTIEPAEGTDPADSTNPVKRETDGGTEAATAASAPAVHDADPGAAHHDTAADADPLGETAAGAAQLEASADSSGPRGDRPPSEPASDTERAQPSDT